MADEKDSKNKSLIVREKQSGFLESVLTNLPPEKREEILSKAAEEVVKIEIEALGKKRKSDIAMEEVNEVFTLFQDVKTDKVTDSVIIKSKHETGTGRVEIKARKGVGCFVATIAFDSPEAEEVRFLRDFRDNVLCHFMSGKKFIYWYYINGHKLAIIVRRYYWIKWSIRKLLSFLIRILKAMQ